MTKYLVTGMSHVHALQRAAEEVGETAFRFEILKPTAGTLRGRTRMMLRMAWQRLRYRPDVLCLLLGGNVHNIIGLLNHPTPFHLTPDGGKGQFVAGNMMRAGIEQRYAQQFALSDKIASAYPRALRIVISAPPPLCDADHIRKYAGGFRPNLGQGISPDDHRLALFAHQTEVFRAYATRIGARFISPAPEALTESGMLALPFSRNDPTHANSAYGALMLARIRAVAEQQQ